MKINIIQDIPLERIHDLLVDALEGGSNYWYMIDKKVEPREWSFTCEIENSEGKHFLSEYPLNPGGELVISSTEDEEDGTSVLNLSTIRSGLEIMAHDYPVQWGDFMSENEDGDTADCFLQCCLFNKVIYG